MLYLKIGGEYVVKIDYKKMFKELYQPGTKPSVIDVPEMKFIKVDGRAKENRYYKNENHTALSGQKEIKSTDDKGKFQRKYII